MLHLTQAEAKLVIVLLEQPKISGRFGQVQNHIEETMGRQLSNNLNEKTSGKNFNSMKLTSKISNSNIQTYLKEGAAFSIESEQHSDSNPKLVAR